MSELSSHEQHLLLIANGNGSNLSQENQLPEETAVREKRKLSKRKIVIIKRNELIENFNEFLASRNIVNNSCSYKRYKDTDQPKLQDCKNEAFLATNSEQFEANCRLQDDIYLYHQPNNQPLKFSKNLNNTSDNLSCSGKSANSKKRVRKLLLALLSRNNKLNKTKLLISLLRAPIVLAALFSLLLIATLIILYTMSFHHYHLSRANCTNNTDSASSASESITRLEQTAAASTAASNHLHIINSRHLSSKAVGQEHFERALTVQTECGSFVGSPEDRAITFRGIPYASPPIGRRRWIRPQPIWLDKGSCQPNRTTKAHESRPHCAQISPITKLYSGDEDCLYLDIFTPKLSRDQENERKLPVMVYIHGGFLSFGSSGDSSTDELQRVNWMKARPSGQLASELNVIIVALNYRLQALGFITLIQLAENNGPFGSEGNYGLWDQLAALNWIKRNIESFGGSNENIIIFGSDSASSLPLAMLSHLRQPDNSGHYSSSSAARQQLTASKDEQGPRQRQQQQHLNIKDLFRAVWLTNPTIYYNMSYEMANKHYQRLFLQQLPCQANATNVKHNNEPDVTTSNDQDDERGNDLNDATNKTLDCLMNLTSKEVLHLYLGKDDPSYRLDDQNSLPIHGIYADQFVTVDGELVRDAFPFLGSLGENGNCSGSRMPDMLLGSTAQAVEYWPCPRNLHQWTWADLRRYVSTSLNSFISNTFTAANDLYKIPNANGSSCNQAKGPKETYLSMVSDIRQVCPVNELSRNLNELHGSRSVLRYIVEQKPSAPVATLTDEPTSQVEFAFHNWDLMAFFGFEFEDKFKPSEKDLIFQRNLRELIRKFAHQHQEELVSKDKSDFLIFAENNQVTETNEYKREECSMWQKHLGQYYAWVS